mmetsp:Transcript_48971/g.74012  ORF Transcript_48971/g.74012 Transcript_48971/m.74012 type:complete len:86 (+) Transcript_48971:48-305(+)
MTQEHQHSTYASLLLLSCHSSFGSENCRHDENGHNAIQRMLQIVLYDVYKYMKFQLWRDFTMRKENSKNIGISHMHDWDCINSAI